MAISLMAVVAHVTAHAAPLHVPSTFFAISTTEAAAVVDPRLYAADAAIALGAHELGLVFAASAAGVAPATIR